MERYEELIQSYFDGELSGHEGEEFLSWLRADPEHARILVLEAHSRKAIRDILMNEATVSEALPDQRRSPLTRFLIPMALAASLLVVAGWFVISQWMKGPEVPATGVAIARITSTNPGVVIQRGQARVAAQTGSGLCVCDRIETGAGQAAAFVYGGENTRIDIRPASDLRLKTSGAQGNQLHLEHGGISVSVARQSGGGRFVIMTPQARATMLGTRFGLAVDSRKTRLDVDEGLVEFARLSDGASINVSAGQLAPAGKEYALKAYPKGAEYVDEDAGFRDDFSRGLGHWELVRADVDETNLVSTTDYLSQPNPDGKHLRVERAKGGKEPATYAVLDARGLGGRLAMRCTKKLLPGEAVSIEWTLCVTDVGTRNVSAGWVLDNMSLLNMVLNRNSDFLLTVGQWVHYRIECVPLADQAGHTMMDVREYHDGRLVSRRHDACKHADWTIMMSARNAKTSIRDVTIRKMLPLDGTAKKRGI